MITVKAEKQKKFLNSLRRSIFILFFLYSALTLGQENTSNRTLKKVGVLYNSAKENNLLFTDKDYDYKTNAFKVQLFYNLKKWGKWNFNLVVQPQFQIAKHQLLNEFFVTPDEPNFELLREKFTQEKTLSLYAFELGFQLRRPIISNRIFFEANFGLGAGYIDVETERLAQGFTFIENISLGFAYSIKNSEIYLGANLGHVSNFDIQLPNSGYNMFGFEIGYRILTK